MASRRCLRALTQTTPFLFRNASSLRSFAAPPFPHATASSTVSAARATVSAQWQHLRYFSSDKKDDHSDQNENDDDSEEDFDDDEEEDYVDDDDDDDVVSVSRGKKVYTAEEMEEEAAAIGYRVVGPLLKEEDSVFKPYEPVFAVVQIGSHQFKVSNRDSIFTERLKFCEVNDKLVLNKVLLLGSASQTIIGRPTVPDAAVHAVVEEHALDAKVIIFKKKRRKNYRRTRGHRQELTKLRITDIQGIEKPQNVLPEKPPKPAKKEKEKVAVAA